MAYLLAAYLAAQSADVATSLRLPAPQYREVNPFVPSRPVPFVALKASVTTAVALYGWRQRKAHPRLAVAMFVAGAASGSIAATLNARTFAHRRSP